MDETNDKAFRVQVCSKQVSSCGGKGKGKEVAGERATSTRHIGAFVCLVGGPFCLGGEGWFGPRRPTVG